MLILIFIAGFLVRLVNLNQSLWLDEAITAVTVQSKSYDQIITAFSKSDFHPPMYYLFLKAWSGIFGFTEISLRFPSVLFGSGLIIFGYLIAKHLKSKKVGLIAALLIALNPLLVYYSQEARMYSLATFLVTGSVWFLLKKKPLWYILFLTASLYTDYLPWLMLPVYLLIAESKAAAVKWTTLALLFVVPWLPFLLIQVSSSLSAGTGAWGDLLGRTSLRNLALIPIKFVFGRITMADKFIYVITFGSGAAFYLITAVLGNLKKIWLWFLLPIFLGAVISMFVPLLSYFRFLFVVPALLILVASGSSRAKLLPFIAVSIAIFSLVWFNLNPKFFREDWRSLANEVTRSPGIILMPSLAQDAPIEYYKPFILRQDLTKINLDLTQRVYLLRYVQEVFDPKDLAKSTLESSGFKRTGERDYNGLVTWIYER